MKKKKENFQKEAEKNLPAKSSFGSTFIKLDSERPISLAIALM